LYLRGVNIYHAVNILCKSMPLSISSIVRDVCSQLMAVKYYFLSLYSIPILENLDWAKKKNLINCGYKQLMTSYLLGKQQ